MINLSSFQRHPQDLLNYFGLSENANVVNSLLNHLEIEYKEVYFDNKDIGEIMVSTILKD